MLFSLFLFFCCDLDSVTPIAVRDTWVVNSYRGYLSCSCVMMLLKLSFEFVIYIDITWLCCWGLSYVGCECDVNAVVMDFIVVTPVVTLISQGDILCTV